jgi:hypothetical protein
MPTPSLILVPARFKTGKLYTPLATTSGGVVLGASGDFNVTRATTATRVNASGLIEVVASGIPRLDYPIGGGCPALLVEPSGTNGILNSENTATNWALGANLSSGYVDVIGVSGNNLTVAVSGSNIGTSAGRLTRANNNFALASGSTYTISFLIKKTGTHTIGGYYALLTGAASGNLGGGFDVSGSFSSGMIYNTAGTTNRIRRVEEWGTDVYRCSETFTMTASGTLGFLYFAPVSGVTSAFNPAVGLGIAFAAPQVELGSLPTSFIPTTTAAATRNADNISLSGAVSGCVGQTEGTIYAEVDLRALSVARSIFGVSLNSNTTDFANIQINSSNRIFARIRSNTGTVQDVTASSTVTGTTKIAMAYDSSGSVLAINGAIIGTNASGIASWSSGVNFVHVGNGPSAASGSSQGGFFNDRIGAPVLYTTRLTNAQLQALTT